MVLFLYNLKVLKIWGRAPFTTSFAKATKMYFVVAG